MTRSGRNIKAVIPVAGVGTKLRPHTFTQPKPLIPVAGKPIISYIIDKFLAAGIEEFVIIIGYLGDKIRLYIEGKYPDLKVEYVHQDRRLGLAHAIWTAQEAIAEADEVIIALGDTIVVMDYEALLKEEGSSIGVSMVKKPGEFGVVEVGDNGFLTKAVEKPNIPTSNLGIVGIYKLNNVKALIKAINKIVLATPQKGEEFHLTDAIMAMIEAGEQIKTFNVTKWFDCGKRDILLETNATLLAEGRNSNEMDIDSYETTIIIQPVSIGKNCIIKNSIVGPNVTVGSNATIMSSILDNSIVGSFATLKEVVMRNSLIGNDAFVKGQYLSLNIGENTEIEFG